MKQRYIIKTEFDLCTGCRLCQLACSFRLYQGYSPSRALLEIENCTENLYHFPVVCNQCENAYCANVCPVGAIDRNENTGALVVDPETCIGCGLCARYCPIGVVKINPETQKAVKCDLCDGKVECAKACPTGALKKSFISDVTTGSNEKIPAFNGGRND